jgi:hypothetical protein
MGIPPMTARAMRHPSDGGSAIVNARRIPSRPSPADPPAGVAVREVGRGWGAGRGGGPAAASPAGPEVASHQDDVV